MLARPTPGTHRAPHGRRSTRARCARNGPSTPTRGCASTRPLRLAVRDGNLLADPPTSHRAIRWETDRSMARTRPVSAALGRALASRASTWTRGRVDEGDLGQLPEAEEPNSVQASSDGLGTPPPPASPMTRANVAATRARRRRPGRAPRRRFGAAPRSVRGCRASRPRSPSRAGRRRRTAPPSCTPYRGGRRREALSRAAAPRSRRSRLTRRDIGGQGGRDVAATMCIVLAPIPRTPGAGSDQTARGRRGDTPRRPASPPPAAAGPPRRSRRSAG